MTNERNKKLTYEYIRGLIEGEGCFTFCAGFRNKNGKKSQIPTFALKMHIRDYDLILKVSETLDLKNNILICKPWRKDGHKRGAMAALMVRDFQQLKDIIIPLCHRKLYGYKAEQFVEWIEKIGSDPDVSDRYKSLYRLYVWGIYDKHPNFKDKFLE